jgi:hypothetical protein
MNPFDHINGIHPATIGVDRRSNQHQFEHTIQLVVSTSPPCYDFQVGFTDTLGFLFLDHKTMKVTKNKVSIHCLSRCSGVMIDTLLKTGWYCSKAHASCAILQAARTARL